GREDAGYLEAWAAVERAVGRFAPDLLLVSCGFDAHVEDPLADLELSTGCFRELASRATQLAPRVAAVLEGGYNLRTLPWLVEAALEGFDSSAGYRAAASTSSASRRDETPSLASRLFTCERTVCSEIPSSAAISSVARCRSSRSSTSTSRADSRSPIDEGTVVRTPTPSRTCSSSRRA